MRHKSYKKYNALNLCGCLSAFLLKLMLLHLPWVAFLWEIIMSMAEDSPGDYRASLCRPLSTSLTV